MIRTTIAAAALLLAALPASAGSFFPTLYGARFCELRRAGISLSEARTVAMKEAWSDHRERTYVTYEGKQTSLDVLDATRYVVTNCPELLQ
jgi:hypothetical protein